MKPEQVKIVTQNTMFKTMNEENLSMIPPTTTELGFKMAAIGSDGPTRWMPEYAPLVITLSVTIYKHC